MQQAADHDHIIEVPCFVEGLPRLDLNAATRPHWRQCFADYRPSAPHWLAEIGIVAGKTQEIHKAGKCGQREIRQKDDSEPHGRPSVTERKIGSGRLCSYLDLE
ncbi:hypothetical protein PPGU19_045270 [Paraburkholderia sp. PGU19]|nr:hypothetical protein PPGU19_045270 [Paraburkholderia sp. PGU19]